MSTALATTPLERGIEITDASRDAWLAERRLGIGASEAASALGICPYRTPLELYLQKIGAAPDVEPTEAMRLGIRLEPVILGLYHERVAGSSDAATHYQVQQFVRSERHPWMSATLDAVRDDGRPVELKSVGWRMAHLWGEEGTDEIPESYLCQVHHQIAVTGAEAVDVAALIGGQEFRLYTVRRDAALLALLVEREAEFWDRVERREPPPAVAGLDGRLLAYLHPGAQGEVALDEEAALDLDLYQALGAEINAAQKRRDAARTRLLEHMGGAAFGRVADGRRIKRTVIDHAATTREIKAYRETRLTIGKARMGDGQE